MGCCGKNRITQAELDSAKIPPMPIATANAGARALHAQAAAIPHPRTGSVPVRYLESTSIVARGPATGRTYTFSGANPVQLVDVRDATAFVNTRYFRRA
jgi:hypothetical protein